jgi:hypothetical protein
MPEQFPAIRSYFARLVALGDDRLLGGARRHDSPRFASRRQAESWMASGIKVNRQAGHECSGRVLASSRAPEIPKG